MIFFWRIRYLDTRDKQFKDRVLWLDTDSLDPIMKASVEATYELREPGQCSGMLRFRHLFQEEKPNKRSSGQEHLNHGNFATHPFDYCEDENGKKLSRAQMGEILTGKRGAILFPSSAKQYEIDFALADRHPVIIDQITLSSDAFDILGIFARDLRELRASSMFREGPGTLKSCEGSEFTLHTAANDEEIRSFVTIFRRRYMDKEPGNFIKAAAVYADAVNGNSLACFVQGIASEYRDALAKPPKNIPVPGCTDLSFNVKRLIDVYLNTQYAHQPSKDRCRQFEKCLQAVGGSQDKLRWLFLNESWACSLHMNNAGTVMIEFYDYYCHYSGKTGNVISSASCASPGIGTQETKKARRERIISAKAVELAKVMWMNEGSPAGGYTQFASAARKQLDAAIKKTDV